MSELTVPTLAGEPRAPDLIGDPPEPLPCPDGWRIVPHIDPNLVAYEVTREIDLSAWRDPCGSPGLEMCGLNATQFRGFPPETLDIGSVEIRLFNAVGKPNMARLLYRFLYKPGGWRRPGDRRPVFDFHRLPL